MGRGKGGRRRVKAGGCKDGGQGFFRRFLAIRKREIPIRISATLTTN
jgi:hypothetical protein